MAGNERLRELVERAQSGDREAFDEVARRFEPRLEGFVRARMGDRVRARLDPDDVLNETFCAALHSIARLEWRSERSFFHWLTGIAENVIRNAARKKRPELLETDPAVEAVDASPSQNLRRRERRDRLRASLKQLPPHYREALELTRVDGLRIDEVASRMGRSPDAVKKLLARGLRELRRTFGETESLSLPGEFSNEERGES